MEAYSVNSLPPRYRHRYRIWRSTLLLLFLAIAVLCAIHYPGNYVHPLAYLLAPIIISVALIRAAMITAEGGWECRIEAGILSWHSPRNGWSDLPLAELTEVVRVEYPYSDKWYEYELVTAKGDRFVLDHRVIDFDLRGFKSAVMAENRAVTFSSRNGLRCYKCGEDLRVRRDCCPNCGTAIPQ